MTVDQDLWEEWDAFAVPRPPIPAELGERMARVDVLTLSTRPLPWSLYALDRYVDEATEGADPYLAIGQAGHGVNSWAMHYYLLSDELQLFVQSRFGGAYANEQHERRQLKTRFDLIDRLLRSTTQGSSPVGPLRVVESDLAHSSWGPANSPTPSPHALRDAVESLHG